MALGPRYYDPANRQSNFAVAVGSALSGFSGMQDYKRKKQLEAESDEDRQRRIDREARQDAEKEYEEGIAATPNGAQPPAPTTAPAAPVAPASDAGYRDPDENAQFGAPPSGPAKMGGGDVAPTSSLANAVGVQLAGTQPQAPAPPPNATMPAARVPAAPAVSGGLREKVGSVLGRMGDAVSTGGYHGYTPPTYSVTRTGPSAREREEGVKQTGETAREGTRERNAADIAAGNNRTAIEVANINAGSREAVARAKAAQDQKLKLSMQAVATQINESDRAIGQLEKEYDRAEPTLVDNSEAKAKKLATQQRIQRQMDRLRQQRGDLAQRQQTMMLGMAAGVTDFSGLLPPPTAYNPNDESQLSDADLWEKKRGEGMTPEQATAFVRGRQRAP